MSSAMPGARHRKPTRRPGRKAPSLRPDSNTSVTAGGRVVKYVKHFNYLGMKLENTLTFANETVRMVAHKLYLLSRIRKYITIGQSIAIYKSKVVPYFDYGDVFLFFAMGQIVTLPV